MVKNWPGDEYEGLLQEAAEDPDAKWDKTEAFFIQTGTKKKFDLRIKIWLFKLQLDQTVQILIS